MDVAVAPATPWGHAALGVVRFSGDGLDEVLRCFIRPRSGWPVPANRPRRVVCFDDEGVFDDGVLVVGRGPHTYTGEDTAELTCHGNPAIVERIVEAAVTAGAQLASPGEFTRRAVLHGKLDLLRAEAVLQVSRATTRRGLAVGRDGLDGALGQFVAGLRTQLLAAAAELEARLDYPADELALDTDEVLLRHLGSVADRVRSLAATQRAGRVLVNGARVALVGTVNAGKSSLFNALVGRQRALVHAEPGTTRDVLEVSCVLDGVAVTLLDTAGERPTLDPVEAAGLALARELVADADLLVVVLRARRGGPEATERMLLERTEDQPRVVVYNGVDRLDVAPAPPGSVSTAATTGQGVDALATAIKSALVGEEPGEARLVIASARQRELLLTVARQVDEAVHALPFAGPAAAAQSVIHAIEAIDTMTGAETREAVLDTLFARFCIGK